MKLLKAREILELNIKEAGKKMPTDTLDALKLAVMCIVFREGMEKADTEHFLLPLPGETSNDESP